MKKVIVVYYSQTGNTRKVAKKISDLEHADMYEVKRLNENASDVGMMLRRWADPLLPLKKTTSNSLVNLEEYDHIYIGTPTWGVTYSQPIKEFIDSNKFTGKTVSLFSTHDGGPGTSVSGMKRKLRDANIDKTLKIISSTCHNDYALNDLLSRWISNK